MKKIEAVILCTECREKATGLMGRVTHWQFDMSGRLTYLFQPKGLNPEDGQPVEKMFLEPGRLELSPNDHEYTEVPVEILGSHVVDKASGFAGMAVAFIKHPNGCFHVMIQPPGVLERTNSRIKVRDFDLRQCEGEKIPVLTKQELEKSKVERPSPTGDVFATEPPDTSGGFDQQ